MAHGRPSSETSAGALLPGWPFQTGCPHTPDPVPPQTLDHSSLCSRGLKQPKKLIYNRFLGLSGFTAEPEAAACFLSRPASDHAWQARLKRKNANLSKNLTG